MKIFKQTKWLALMGVIMIAATGCQTSKPVPGVLGDANGDSTTSKPAPAPVEKTKGEKYREALTAYRPMAVMLDNHSGARPQAGLKSAEVVVEALAEGNITRYMAIFFTSNSEPVGPIRSSRPYFIDRAMEYKALYVHVGGSPQALSDIRKYKVADLDGLTSSGKVFWRKKHKKMPHNQYSTLEVLRSEADRKKYDSAVEVSHMTYNNDDLTPSGESATSLLMPYRKKTSKDSGYSVSYQFDPQTMLYNRYINGVAHKDEIDDSQIAAKNLIVQVVPTRVVDDKGRLDLELVGSGKGFYLSMGIKVPIQWQKDDRFDRTIYSDETGKELSFNPGKTWIQIVPASMKLTFEPTTETTTQQ